MKKIISTLLVLLLTFGITVAASAATATPSITVSGEGTNGLHVDFSMELSNNFDISKLKIVITLDEVNTYEANCYFSYLDFHNVNLTSYFHYETQDLNGKTSIAITMPGAGAYSSGKLSIPISINKTLWQNFYESYAIMAYYDDVEIYPENKTSPQTITNSGESAQFNIIGNYQVGTQADTVYSVDVAWGSMEVTYSEGNDGTWDPLTHEYKNAVPAGWSWDTDANKITVTNRSNAAIDAGLSYTNAKGFDLTATFADSKNAHISNLSLPTAEGYGETEAGPRTAAAYMNITDGILTSDTTSKTTLGTITVTISDAE